MLRLGAFVIFTVILLVVILGNLVSCSSQSPLEQSLDASAGTAAEDQLIGQEAPVADFPPFPVEGTEDNAYGKGVSWLYNADPTAPVLQHRTALCAVHPDCLQLIGLPSTPLTHVPPKPWFAYAIYQLPLGAYDVDLEKLNLYGAMDNPGDQYFVAVSNFSTMTWQWYGPGTGDYTVDFSTVAYDFTGPLGNMFVAVVVPAFDAMHLWGIELDFADNPDNPKVWNAWGRAYDSYIPGLPPVYAAGETVTFEDTLTSTVFSTTTSADGAWGLNLPDGYYKFSVTGNLHLFDPSPAFMIIDDLPVIMEMNSGQLIYHGSNAMYDGNAIPMPIITLNVF